MKTLTVLLIAGALAACSHELLPPFSDRLSPGTWGGNNAGAIVDDTLAHVHIGCTYGNFKGPTPLDANGHFSVSGDYMLRAYPIEVGPSVPAQFNGDVDGNVLTLTVIVNDTVEKKTQTLGPVVLKFGKEPQMGPCPICRKPRAINVRPEHGKRTYSASLTVSFIIT